MKKYFKAHMNTAEIFAEMSSSTKHKVGCVIARGDRIISTSFNGTIPGVYNVCEEFKRLPAELEKNEKIIDCPDCVDKGCNPCIVCEDKGSIIVNDVTLPYAVTAEENAIMYCVREGLSTKNCVLFSTLSPTAQAARIIAQSGITKVFYKDKCKNPKDGIDFLLQCGILCFLVS